MYEFPTKSNGFTSRQNKRVGFTAPFAKLHEFSVEFLTTAGKKLFPRLEKFRMCVQNMGGTDLDDRRGRAAGL